MLHDSKYGAGTGRTHHPSSNEMQALHLVTICDGFVGCDANSATATMANRIRDGAVEYFAPKVGCLRRIVGYRETFVGPHAQLVFMYMDEAEPQCHVDCSIGTRPLRLRRYLCMPQRCFV